MSNMTEHEDDREWTIEGFLAECEAITTNPPAAPEGLELIECEAEPRHWPTYAAYVDGQYPSPCPSCVLDDLSRQNAKLRCESDHRRWKSWNVWSRIASRLYVLGITSSGGGTSYGRCQHCGIGRQHMAPHWRGRRSYVLGVKRETWTCLRRGHRRQESPSCGLCTVCAPCSECGSTDRLHVDGVDCAQLVRAAMRPGREGL